MAEPERENCSRIYFCYAALILRTNSKFQTLLTLSSHNSGLKNYSIKSHHILRASRTSAFIWHALDASLKNCIGVIHIEKIAFYCLKWPKKWPKWVNNSHEGVYCLNMASSSLFVFINVHTGGSKWDLRCSAVHVKV